MAGRRQDLETRIVAKDDASKVIDKVADKAEQLEKPVEIPLTADDKASAGDQVAVASCWPVCPTTRRRSSWTRRSATLNARSTGSCKSLSRVDSMSDEEVTVRVEALDHAKGDLDRIQAEMRELDGETATVHVEATGLDEITDSLGDLPGSLGPLGGASGQGRTGRGRCRRGRRLAGAPAAATPRTSTFKR